MELAALAGLLDVDEPVVLVLRHDPHPAAQRLLAALGCGWIVDPVNGERCAQRCGRKECTMIEQSAHTAAETRLCKMHGCTQEAVARMGKFAGLCSEHILARRRAEQGHRPAPAAAAPATVNGAQRQPNGTDGLAAKVKQLAAAGKNVDKLRAKAARLAETALAAKRAADQAERDFQQLARELMGERAG